MKLNQYVEKLFRVHTYTGHMQLPFKEDIFLWELA